MAAKQIPISTFASIPLSILDEDPHQPRTAFDARAIEQLTESIMTARQYMRRAHACTPSGAWRGICGWLRGY